MDADQAAARFAALAVRRRLSLGVMHSAKPEDFALVLAAAARVFAPVREYRERDVNDLLRAWLADAGAMLDVDHVELRRWLVDTGVLARDGFGRAYALGTPRADVAAAIAALAPHDPAALSRAACDDEAARRAERKARWAAGVSGAVET
ncbi:MAG: DUF2087 domain-containing protein [Burkholderiales bacterium]|nr:DUF2087 domain-containing protein [Burkholderiales bacterium]